MTKAEREKEWECVIGHTRNVLLVALCFVVKSRSQWGVLEVDLVAAVAVVSSHTERELLCRTPATRGEICWVRERAGLWSDELAISAARRRDDDHAIETALHDKEAHSRGAKREKC